MKAFLLLLVLAGAVGAALYFFVFDKATPSSAARIVSVEPRLTGTASAVTIVVDVEVEAVGAMPPVGPHVIVTATCEASRDEVIGDVALMNNAAAGDKKTDAVELFTSAPFDNPPTHCSITARTSDSGSSASACLELGTARAGGC
jgi:hypothetical protein